MSAYGGFTDPFFAAESAMVDVELSLLFYPLLSPPPPTEAGEPVEAVEAGVNDLAAQFSPFFAPSFAGSVKSDSALSPLFSPPPSPSPIADETSATTIGDENDYGDGNNDYSALSSLFSAPPSPSPVSDETTTTPIGSDENNFRDDYSDPSPVERKTSDKPKPKARSSAHSTKSNYLKASGGQSPGSDKKSHAKGCKRKSNSCDYCKRRQIKCDRDNFDACTACLKKGIDCVYNIVPGKRGALKASQEGVAMGRTVSGSLINGGLPSTPCLSSSPSSNASVAIHTPPRAAPATSTVVVPAYLYAQLASTSSANYDIVAEPSAPVASSGASAPTQLYAAPVATGPEVNLEGEFDFDQFYRDIGLVVPAPEVAPSAPAASSGVSHLFQLPAAPVASGPEVNLEGEFDFDQFYRDIGPVAPAPEVAPEMMWFNDVGC
ncbi:hypothetical protein I350_06174 [Cryptococcus amylolentus CBS 6273]|uniref:Zn(2)-C6 fungal-type domain-containing protein n=1 Tax=Cryptococcus amylolentus CBS 6273 TaxID=1296118 RepID=A0A1E3JKG8_9TREE|nr:hypothetical protein I350_06174 [Cryptococcus amylolentus CBS 6273]